VLGYLGLSVHQDQVFNATLDGPDTRRALIPGSAHAAWYWLEMQRAKKMQSQKHRSKQPLFDTASLVRKRMDASAPQQPSEADSVSISTTGTAVESKNEEDDDGKAKSASRIMTNTMRLQPVRNPFTTTDLFNASVCDDGNETPTTATAAASVQSPVFSMGKKKKKQKKRK
jgi:hypothetical protein